MTKLKGSAYTAKELVTKYAGQRLQDNRYIAGYYTDLGTGIIVGSNEFLGDSGFESAKLTANPRNVLIKKNYTLYGVLSDADVDRLVHDVRVREELEDALKESAALTKKLSKITPTCQSFMDRFDDIKVVTINDKKTVVALNNGNVGVAIRFDGDVNDERVGILEAYVKALTNPEKPTKKSTDTTPSPIDFGKVFSDLFNTDLKPVKPTHPSFDFSDLAKSLGTPRRASAGTVNNNRPPSHTESDDFKKLKFLLGGMNNLAGKK